MHGAKDVKPLLVWGSDAVGVAPIRRNVTAAANANDWPLFSFAGWLHAGGRRFGNGRVVVLGEAAMCSAQLAGPGRFRMGMNAPYAAQNPQFCLNAVRWLTGALD
jgi:hypothetical protein